MRKTPKKLNKKRCLVALLVLIIAIVIIILLFGKNDKNEILTVLLNNEIIELSDVPIIDEEQNIYFSKDDIQNIFDENMYKSELQSYAKQTFFASYAMKEEDDKNPIGRNFTYEM